MGNTVACRFGLGSRRPVLSTFFLEKASSCTPQFDLYYQQLPGTTFNASTSITRTLTMITMMAYRRRSFTGRQWSSYSTSKQIVPLVRNPLSGLLRYAGRQSRCSSQCVCCAVLCCIMLLRMRYEYPCSSSCPPKRLDSSLSERSSLTGGGAHPVSFVVRVLRQDHRIKKGQTQ